MFTERERHALYYAVEVAIKEDSQHLINRLEVGTLNAIYWDARNLATLGRLSMEIQETLS